MFSALGICLWISQFLTLVWAGVETGVQLIETELNKMKCICLSSVYALTLQYFLKAGFQFLVENKTTILKMYATS